MIVNCSDEYISIDRQFTSILFLFFWKSHLPILFDLDRIMSCWPRALLFKHVFILFLSVFLFLLCFE